MSESYDVLLCGTCGGLHTKWGNAYKSKDITKRFCNCLNKSCQITVRFLDVPKRTDTQQLAIVHCERMLNK